MLMYIFFYLLYSPAEAFFKHAVEIKENALGRDHPSLVKVISLHWIHGFVICNADDD